MIMSNDQIKWDDAQFYSLESQTNIYNLSKVETASAISNKVLVSSIDGEVIAVEYQQHTNGVKPSVRRIQFTYIPGDAEIVSIDAFTNNEKSPTLVVGITFLKIAKTSSSTVSGRYLNIYSCLQPDRGQDLDSIAESCQHMDLEYIPYQLTHISIPSDNIWETVFLLAGSDHRVHVYKEDTKLSQFEELQSDIFFPEFSDISSCVLWLDTVYIDNHRHRVTALGEQSGLVSVFVVNLARNEITKHFTTEFDGPITTVLLFTDTNNEVKQPDCVSSSNEHGLHLLQPTVDPVYHLLVTASIETSQVFHDVVHEGLDVIMPLPDSDLSDVVMCACVVDVDFDGHPELVLGTYGQELLVYKYYPAHQLANKDVDHDKFVIRRSPAMPYSPPLLDIMDSKLRHKSSDIPDPKLSHDSATTRRTRSQEDLPGASTTNQTGALMTAASSKGSVSSEDDLFYARDAYQLLWKIAFTEPILAVDKMDVTGDGIEEILVASLKGLHVLQPDLCKVAQLCEQRLKSCTEQHKTEVT